LKTKDEVLNEDKFDKAALISTAEGKTITSTYLAKRVEMLEIGETITLDINMSEIVLSVSENEENLTPANSRVAYFADFARNDGIVLLPNITVSSFSYIMETFPLEFFDLISNFDFL
jgi:hypothetical protein